MSITFPSLSSVINLCCSPSETMTLFHRENTEWVAPAGPLCDELAVSVEDFTGFLLRSATKMRSLESIASPCAVANSPGPLPFRLPLLLEFTSSRQPADPRVPRIRNEKICRYSRPR